MARPHLDSADFPTLLSGAGQDSDGTVYFDNRAGRMNEFSGTQKMTMETTVGNMSFKQQVETTATMKLGRPTSAGNP